MDQIINKMRTEYEVHNYLKYNEKPHFLQKKTTYDSTFYKYYSQPIETTLVSFDILPSNISNLKETIQKCQKIQNILLNTHANHTDECPVCYTEFGTTNFILPKCGHKVCISCFTNNAIRNRDGANVCCLCRNPILHT